MIKFKINNRIISENHEPLIIAEIGINHNGNLELCNFDSETQQLKLELKS